MSKYEVENVISGEEAIANLFTGSPEPEQPANPENKPEGQETHEPSTEEQPPAPESVGSGEEQHKSEREEEKPSNQEQPGSSPNLYSSIARSLREDGTLPDFSDEEIAEITDAATLVNAFKKQAKTIMDDEQKRVHDALEAGMEPTRIQQYTGMIKQLNAVTEEQLADENNEELRKNIIMLAYTSKNFTKERAEKEANKSISAGTDIEDAKEYLEDLKSYYQSQYQSEIESAQKEKEKVAKETKDNADKLKASILDKNKKLFGELDVNIADRQKAVDNLTKPIHKDANGNFQSAIGKYIAENPMEYQYNMALLFTLTNGFKEMGNLIKGTVKKEKKQVLSEIEQAVQNTQRKGDGGLDFFGNPDPNSTFKGWQIDV